MTASPTVRPTPAAPRAAADPVGQLRDALDRQVYRRLRNKWRIWTTCVDARARRVLETQETDPTQPNLVELGVRGLPRPILVRRGSGNGGPDAWQHGGWRACDDRGTFWEVFFKQVYDAPVWRAGATVLDLGANIGLLPAWLVRRGLTPARYVAAEPDPATFELLRQQVDRLGLGPAATLCRVAAGEAEGTARFDAGGESILHRLSDDGGLEVPVRRVGQLLDDAGVDVADVMKLDVEGGEEQVTADAADWAPRVRSIVGELHEHRDARWLDARLRRHGFRVFPFGAFARESHAAVCEEVFADLPEATRRLAID